MPPKRKRETLQEILDKCWCWYCEKDCTDLKALQDHQKAKHLKCHECGKKLDSIGGLKVHVESVHKTKLEKIENAIPERESPEGPEIYLMEGIPQEMKDAYTARLVREHEKEEHDYRIRTGNYMPGSVEALNQNKKPKVEEETPEQRKAKREAWVAMKRAEKAARAEAAKQNENALATTNKPADDFASQEEEIKLEQNKPEPMHQEYPAANANTQYYPGYSMSPPMAGLPSSMPPQQPYGYPPQPQFGYSPPAYAQPPMQQPYAPPPFPQQPIGQSPVQQQYAPPPFPQQPVGYGYAGSPQPFPPQPRHARSPSNANPRVKNEHRAGDEKPSIPPLPSGLPQRPSFDAPSYSKSAMEKLHDHPRPGYRSGAELSGISDPHAGNVSRSMLAAPANAQPSAELRESSGAPSRATEDPHPGQDKKGEGKKTLQKYTDNFNSPEEKKSKQPKYTKLTFKKPRNERGDNTVVDTADTQAVTGSVADDLEQ